METVRLEILPGVWFTALESGKFKTGCLSINLLTQLDRDTASQNALIPYVLRRGSRYHTDMRSLALELDGLYGSCIEPVVRKIGEIQCIGFLASFADDRYLPDGSGVFESVANLCGELLLTPCTKGGLLLPDYVESEKEKLLDSIRGRLNDKRSWALQRLTEQMCCYEAFAVSRLGTEDTAENIHYQKLTKHYRNLIMSSPVEIFYCGSLGADTVADRLSDALSGMPRGEIDYEIGTDIRMNSVEEGVREFSDELAVTQGKLVMGYRLGDCMDDPDIAAMHVFNAVFGGCVTSKLFMNVRERLSLCYYASSLIDLHKGLMIVSSGVDFDKFDAARAEISAQLEAIRRGEVSDGELKAAKQSVASELRSISDSQYSLEGFYLSNTLDGLEFEPEELAAAVECVEFDAIVDIANSIVPDAVYCLRGSGEEDENEA